ncbi:MAG TPA: cysteine desulfurase [Vicinamibacteria bacterium]|nr:cysteine desulfurase [Vicinamibacteria bacterium]
MKTLIAAPPLPLDVQTVRADFPILGTRVHGKPLVYLDSAASAQKPRVVIDSERRVYEEMYANVHRGVHDLSMRASDAYEAARAKVAKFIGAPSPKEVILLRGTTEAINLVAQTWGRVNVKAGDEILITTLEHHANIVPWQMLCEEKGARLVVAPINDAGEVELDRFEELLSARTKIVAFAHVSNALGTILEAARMTALARERAPNAVVLVDGAQGVPHMAVDVKAIGCDFYCFSAHKMYGPSGMGALWGRKPLLDAMPPWQGGGDMILSVTFEKTTYNETPFKFEAGTPNIAGTIAFGASIDYLAGLGLDAVAAAEHELLIYGTDALTAIPGIRLIGTAARKASVLSFVIDGVHPHDAGSILDYEGVAVRTGHHCAQPVMDRFGVPATIRASLGVYNTREDIDALVRGIHKVQEMFA